MQQGMGRKKKSTSLDGTAGHMNNDKDNDYDNDNDNNDDDKC